MPKSFGKLNSIKGGFVNPINLKGVKTPSKVNVPVVGSEPMTKTQLSPQALKEMVKVGTRTATKTKTDTKVGIKFEPGVEFNLNQTFELQNGYEIPNYNGEPVKVDSPNDGTYYENPYVTQDQPAAGVPVTCKTAFNISECDPFASGTASEEALQDIYNDLKIQINNNTGGGNTVTQNVFTYTNFKEYINTGIEFYSILIELMSRQAWSPDETYANLVLRNLAEFTSSTDMISLRNKLSRVLSNMSLPKKVKDYITWFYQVYQVNEGKGSRVQFNVSPSFAEDVITSRDLSAFISEIDGLILAYFTGTDAIALSEKRSQITALLENRTDYDFQSLRMINIPCNTSRFDQSMKDIFVNTAIYDANSSGGADLYPSKLSSTETGPVCFEQSIENVPVHTTEWLCSRFTSNQPAIFKPSYYTNASDWKFSSKFVLYFAANDEGFASTGLKEDRPWNFIMDDAFTLTVVSGTVKWMFIPRGSANIVYQLGYNSVRTAQRKFVYDLFGFKG